jgi:hypothetical protein
LLLGEVNSKNDYTLIWTVHIANKKGSFTKFKGITFAFNGIFTSFLTTPIGRFAPPNEDRRNPDVDPNVSAMVRFVY